MLRFASVAFLLACVLGLLGCPGKIAGSSQGNQNAGDDAPPCSAESSFACGPGSTGYTCASGDDPESYDTGLQCEAVATSNGSDEYCCTTAEATPQPGCASDDALSCPSPGAYGFQCVAGENPTAYDPSFTCSTATPDADGAHDDYCCETPSAGSGPPPLGCAADATIACDGPATGFSCSTGNNPQTGSPGLACTAPQADGSSDGYCCFPFASTPSGCVPRDTLANVCPDASSYPFQCDPGDAPASDYPSLTCSAGVADPDGFHDDYCCALP
jgi:hypothetical protein